MTDAAATVADIAAALGTSGRTVSRWVKDGCPVIRHGRRGHGGAALLDLDAVRAWRESQHDHGDDTGVILEIASLIPDVLAAAVDETARTATGPHKRALCASLAATWYLCTTRTLDTIRARHPDIAHLIHDPASLPAAVQRLRRVADG